MKKVGYEIVSYAMKNPCSNVTFSLQVRAHVSQHLEEHRSSLTRDRGEPVLGKYSSDVLPCCGPNCSCDRKSLRPIQKVETTSQSTLFCSSNYFNRYFPSQLSLYAYGDASAFSLIVIHSLTQTDAFILAVAKTIIPSAFWHQTMLPFFSLHRKRLPSSAYHKKSFINSLAQSGATIPAKQITIITEK